MRIQLNARNRAFHFEADPGARILYAGLAAGVNLPYECGSGTCGTCKARLVEGEIDDLWPQAAGRKYLKQAGEFLMCQCVARNDCAVEVAGFVYNMDPGACIPGFRTGRIDATKMLTHDVLALTVELDQPIDFDAGQFVTMQVPDVPGFRGYSMVNFERATKRFDFVVKKKPGGGASEWLFSGGAAGARVDLFGPLGTATFYPNLGKNLLCIAGGSGIAGMMSILARARQERYFDQFDGHVFFGVRSYRDGFYLAELSELAREFPDRLRVTIALSDEAVPAQASQEHPALRFEHGLVHEVAGHAMQGKYQNVRAYLAGPPPAVDASIRTLLLQAKLPADHIRYDKFKLSLPTNPMQKRFVCPRGQVPANGMVQCETEGGLKLLVANAGDDYFAYQAMCPHQEVPLCEGLYDGAVLTCHQHLWQWDIRTGAPMGLAETALESFPVEVEGDSLYVVAQSALNAAELFVGISDATLAAITALAQKEERPAGSICYDFGDPADDFYVLESGRVEFLIGRDERLSPAGFMLRKGEVFGWAALLDNQPQRIARATCLEPSQLLRINGRKTLDALERDAASGYVVMRRLSSLIARYLASSGSK